MAERVNPRRKYDSSGRQRLAAQNRQAMVEAAQRLFTAQGYVATTMDAVAAEAGVSLKSVYLAYASKSGLLRAAWDLALKGDVDDAPVAERPWYLAVLEEPDPVRQLDLVARASRDVKERLGGMFRAIRDAATVDEDARDLWRLIQSDFWDNQRAIVRSLQSHGGLRKGLTADRAADVLWTLNHPDTWLLLHDERGWTGAEWERWFAAAAKEQLLGPK
jgi:AcrR family transcriptional regulator